MNTKKICVIGLGYIGLPTAALLANRGHLVHGVDIMQNVVDVINRGEIHIVEPELDTFVKSAVNAGRLFATTTPLEADVFIIAVPTPFKDNHVPNIDYVLNATVSIAPYLRKGNIVILESTSPVGTTDKIQETLVSLGVDVSELHIAHCPERVLPGKVMKELIENDRIIGGVNPKATVAAKEFYEEFVSGQVLTTDARTAEMCKLVENSYRDTNIAFANEISMICDEVGINVWELIRLANRHPRVNILQPGAGVGGHCIAVDPWFIVSANPEKAKIIKQARITNDFKSEWVCEKIKNEILEFKLSKNRNPTVAFMGLAFKPDIDDLRESAAVHIITKLLSENNSLEYLIVEPNIEKHPEFTLSDYSDAVQASDIIVYLVAHKNFKLATHNGKKSIMDFCGVFQS